MFRSAGARETSSVRSLAKKLVLTNLDLFRKLDPASVAFTKTGAGTISIKYGTVVELAGLLYSFAVDTAVQMPSLTNGTDYATYMCNDGTVRADANFSAPTGFSTSTSRQIGGFHYAPGGNATATSGGDTTPAINAYSIWDLKWRPSCADPRGMALVAGRFWSDIYLCGVDHYANGTSRYNVTIADGSSPPKVAAAFGGNGSTAYGQFNWWDASEVMRSAGKDLLSYAEYSAACYGTTEGTQAGTDPGSTILTAAFTSKWGLMLSTGNMWVWGRELGGPYSAASWTSDPASRGQYYELPKAVLLGGYWGNGAGCGSRASLWDGAPSGSNNGIGARGRCDHLHHV